MKISFAEFDPSAAGAVVVGVWEEGVLTPPARRLDEAGGGAIARAIAATPRGRGNRKELVPIVGPANLPMSRIVVAGLGKPDAADARALEDLGGTLVAHLNGVGATAATFAIDLGDSAGVSPAAALAHLGFGAALRAYRFDKYRTTERPERKPTLAELTIAGEAAEEARHAYRGFWPPPPRRSPSLATSFPSRPTSSTPRPWPSRRRVSRFPASTSRSSTRSGCASSA